MEDKKVFYYGDDEELNLNIYTHIRAYHTTRCLNESRILDKGIVPWTRDELKTYVRKVCEITGYSYADIINIFDEQFDSYGSEFGHPKVWLNINKQYMLEQAGHYLIYGSEFVIGLFVNAFYTREPLKSVGVPTIFCCDIPVDDINKKWLSDVAVGIKKGRTDLSLYVENVSPDNIISVEHPKEIMDPFTDKMYKVI